MAYCLCLDGERVPIVCVWMEKGCRELATKKLTRVLFFRHSEKYQILTRRGNDEKNAVEIASSRPPTALITILSGRVRHCDLFCVLFADIKFLFFFSLSVANKWLHVRGQEFRRKCSLDPNL